MKKLKKKKKKMKDILMKEQLEERVSFLSVAISYNIGLRVMTSKMILQIGAIKYK